MARVRGGRYESQSPFFLKRRGRRVCDFCMASLTERARVYLEPRWYWLCESCQAGFPAKSGPSLTTRIQARRTPGRVLALRGLALVLAWLLLAQPVWGAAAHVQNTGTVTLNNGSAQTMTFPSLPSAGEAIVVAVCGWHSSPVMSRFRLQSITDNQGNTYTKALDVETGGSTSSHLYLYYTANIPAPSGTFSITVTPETASENFIAAGAAAYSGLEGSNVLDVTATNQTSAPTDASVGPSATTIQNDELVVAAACVEAPDDALNITTPSGYTQRFVHQNAQTAMGFQYSDKVVASTGAQSASWSHDDAATSAGLATFRAAATAPPPVTGTASATLSWVEPTINQDGTPINDLSNTQGFYRRPNSSAWVSCITKNAPVVTGGASQSGTCTVPVPAGTTENVDFMVRPYDQRGNEGTWSPIIIKPLTGS